MMTIADANRVSPTSRLPSAAPSMAGRSFTVFGTFGALFVTRPAALDQAYRVVAASLAGIDRACSRPRLPADDRPVDAAKVHVVEWPKQRLQGQEFHVSASCPQVVDAV